MKRRNGFTLIEMVVVVSLLSTIFLIGGTSMYKLDSFFYKQSFKREKTEVIEFILDYRIISMKKYENYEVLVDIMRDRLVVTHLGRKVDEFKCKYIDLRAVNINGAGYSKTVKITHFGGVSPCTILIEGKNDLKGRITIRVGSGYIYDR